ncbi:MAG: BolA family protein [Pseudomonadota bacterium]
MSVANHISEKLTNALPGAEVSVKDESHLHVGHAGAREGGESHFRLRIVAAQFEGLTRVARQRLVNKVLEDELAGPVHALAMATLTPKEATAAQQ